MRTYTQQDAAVATSAPYSTWKSSLESGACGFAAISLASLLLVAANAGNADAASGQWRVVPETSKIGFEYRSNGQLAEGAFRRFWGEGVFDPKAPSAAMLELHIDSASIDLDDPRASAIATSAEWFDSAEHPEVVYRLQHLVPLGSEHYRAEGDLTIRGTTLPITATIALDLDERTAHAIGTLSVDREDYMLGDGPFSLFVDIGREVEINFDLAARPEP